MNDRLLNLSLTGFVAAIIWAAIVGCWVAMIALAVAGETVDAILTGLVGGPLSAAAATIQIRGFFCKQGHLIQEAFQLGRQVEREQQESARGLHRI